LTGDVLRQVGGTLLCLLEEMAIERAADDGRCPLGVARVYRWSSRVTIDDNMQSEYNAQGQGKATAKRQEIASDRRN
jgi:hypothetical protein